MVEAGRVSEERLLADARRGDEAAFELLVARHLPVWFDGREDVCRFLARRGVRHVVAAGAQRTSRARTS